MNRTTSRTRAQFQTKPKRPNSPMQLDNNHSILCGNKSANSIFYFLRENLFLPHLLCFSVTPVCLPLHAFSYYSLSVLVETIQQHPSGKSWRRKTAQAQHRELSPAGRGNVYKQVASTPFGGIRSYLFVNKGSIRGGIFRWRGQLIWNEKTLKY